MLALPTSSKAVAHSSLLCTDNLACNKRFDVGPLNLVDPQPATKGFFSVNFPSATVSDPAILSDGRQIGAIHLVKATDSLRVRMAMSLSKLRGL